MKDPFFSIILPTFNRASYLEKAIGSVLSQTFEDFELIIVDDGSTDSTRTVVENWQDDRLNYFFKQNEERSIARNFGIARARGRYVNFLDSDDYFYPHHLYTAFKNLTTHNFPTLLHLGFEIRKENGDLIKANSNYNSQINRKIISDNLLISSSFFISRNVLSGINFISSRNAIISEDWCLWLRLAARYPIIIDNTVTNVIIEHPDRSLNNLNPEKVEVSLNLVLDSLKADKEVLHYYASGFKKFTAHNFCFIALCFSIAKNIDKASHYLSLAKAEYPSIIFTRRYLAVKKKVIQQKTRKIFRTGNG
jgi:glycosyltransferase involved in cell wall biosynthesis